jgi:hypothetical protein
MIKLNKKYTGLNPGTYQLSDRMEKYLIDNGYGEKVEKRQLETKEEKFIPINKRKKKK